MFCCSFLFSFRSAYIPILYERAKFFKMGLDRINSKLKIFCSVIYNKFLIYLIFSDKIEPENINLSRRLYIKSAIITKNMYC